MAEFAYNNTKTKTTKISPFYANYKYKPEVYKQPKRNKTGLEETQTKIDKLQKLYQQLTKDIEFANSKIAVYINKKRSIRSPLGKEDKIYLLHKHIKITKPSTKLDFKKLEPFEILEKIGNINFKLKLPKGSRLYLVFHVLLLESAKENTRINQDTDI